MGEEFKLTQFADDLTCSLSEIQSGKELFKLISTFQICSGLKLNISKIEVLWKWKDKNIFQHKMVHQANKNLRYIYRAQ